MDIGYQFAKRLHEQGALAGRAVRLAMKRDALPESSGRRGGLTLSVSVACSMLQGCPPKLCFKTAAIHLHRPNRW